MKGLETRLFILLCLVSAFSQVRGTSCNFKEKQIVYLTDVGELELSDNRKQVNFQITVSRNCTLKFNMQSTLEMKEDKCFVDGFVTTSRNVVSIQLSLCNGVTGEFALYDGTILRIEPILQPGIEIKRKEMASVPHLLTKLGEDIRTHDFSRRIRTRRAPAKTTVLTLINKSGKVVLFYFMDTRYHRRRYFLRLRLNEKNLVKTYVGTTWLAYDRQQNPLLLNGRFNFLVHPKHADKNNVKVVITSRTSISTATRLEQLPEIKPKFVEVLVVADQSMVKHHKNKTKKYINTLMTIVNEIFQHKSLNASVGIAVTDIKILENYTSDLDIPLSNSRKALQQACKYTYDLKKRENLKFDISVTITRTKFGVSGFTPLYRMCVEYKSCTVIHDAGFHSAFIIAHEIAHAIGLAHDGDHNECGPDGPRGSIMYPTVYSKFTRYFWSNCTKFQIRENLDYFPCLNNKPKEYVERNETDLPGVYFNIDEQCQLYHGPGYRNCLGARGADQYCQILFCRIPGKRKRCSYWSLPPIDGTKCAKGKWCFRGKCLQHGLLGPKPINGSWSSWQSWGSCSTTCGRGVRLRKRECGNPRPEFGGRDCNGSSGDWTICEAKPCYYKRVFGDTRVDMCYYEGGSAWKWLSEETMKHEVDVLNLNCTFEHGICGWKHVNDTKSMWILHSGKTPTTKTGPRYDHTYKNKTGHYLYMESSNPLRNGDNIKLTSPRLTVPNVCLRFYYHMYGNKLGYLRVNTSHSNEVWRKTGDHGQVWTFVEISIQHQVGYKIIIEAVRGQSYLNDIAIDDITLTSGLCQQGKDVCKVHCRDTKTNEKKVIIVPNGGRCDIHTSNLCVYGKCQVVGCDGRIGSNATLDKCGVCGGNNRRCQLHHDVLKISPKEPTSTILKIPVGSTNIVVSNRSPSNGKLATRYQKTGKVHYYGGSPTHSYAWHYYVLVNTTFRYQPFENGTQVIYGSGPISDDIQIQLLFPSSEFNQSVELYIEYSFYAPITLNNNTYIWKTHWSKCSTECNGGIRKSSYKCFHISRKITVDDKHCTLPGSVSLVEKIKSCNTHPCKIKYTYKEHPWSECSLCGIIGFRTRNVTCYKTVQNNQPIRAKLKECKENIPVPATVNNCFVYCPRNESVCNELSSVCPSMLKKGYCKYKNVKTLCCKTCKK